MNQAVMKLGSVNRGNSKTGTCVPVSQNIGTPRFVIRGPIGHLSNVFHFSKLRNTLDCEPEQMARASYTHVMCAVKLQSRLSPEN
ncbi:MAG: hypothetical protein ACI80L_001940 [Pseudohongiellaceae bacterium]|jgi:hypothetical protein